MENPNNSNNKSSNRKGNFSIFAPFLAGALFFINPSGADAQNASNHTKSKAEVSTSTILDRLNQKIGVSLPDEYNHKVLDFALNDTIMRTRSATAYTEEFIINEMKKDRGISKQNQLLFIRSEIYGGITGGKLYDILDDEDDDRYNEYDKTIEKTNKSYEEYIKGFKVYMETGIAKAQQRSADAQQRSADAQQRSADALNSALENIVRFYNRYKKDPGTIKNEEIKQRKGKGKQVIQGCKELGLDYKAKLSPEMLKFYGVE